MGVAAVLVVAVAPRRRRLRRHPPHPVRPLRLQVRFNAPAVEVAKRNAKPDAILSWPRINVGEHRDTSTANAATDPPILSLVAIVRMGRARKEWYLLLQHRSQSQSQSQRQGQNQSHPLVLVIVRTCKWRMVGRG